MTAGREGWPALDRVLARLRTVPARTGSVIATVYGDAILPRGGALALSDLIALMGRLGAAEGVVRTAVSRLARDGMLQGLRIGRRSAYALTPRAAEEFAAAVPAIYGTRERAWDGRLRIAFPEDAGQRAVLERGGFRPVGVGTLVGTGAPPLGTLCVEAAGPAEGLAGLAGRAWPLAGIQDMYLAFIDAFAALEPPGDMAPLDAIAARVALLHAWRRVALRDAVVPAPLLPEGWAGTAARQLCIGLYESLAPGSEEWLDEASCGSGPMPPGPPPERRWRS